MDPLEAALHRLAADERLAAAPSHWPEALPLAPPDPEISALVDSFRTKMPSGSERDFLRTTLSLPPRQVGFGPFRRTRPGLTWTPDVVARGWPLATFGREWIIQDGPIFAGKPPSGVDKSTTREHPMATLAMERSGRLIPLGPRTGISIRAVLIRDYFPPPKPTGKPSGLNLDVVLMEELTRAMAKAVRAEQVHVVEEAAEHEFALDLMARMRSEGLLSTALVWPDGTESTGPSEYLPGWCRHG